MLNGSLGACRLTGEARLGDQILDRMGLRACEHGQITKIRLSDGRGGGTIPVTVKIGYCRCRFEGYLGNVGKEGTMALPEVGSTPPAFTLSNQDGKYVSLADYAGRNVLIWFFPRAYGGG